VPASGQFSERTSRRNRQEHKGSAVRGRYDKQKVFPMNALLDFLVTITGLRVLLYGVVVTTIALGVLSMTTLRMRK
jgi:hypothetical protein